MDARRKAFEDWASNNGTWPAAIEKNAKCDYILLQTAYTWMAWEAAADWAVKVVRSKESPHRYVDDILEELGEQQEAANHDFKSTD